MKSITDIKYKANMQKFCSYEYSSLFFSLQDRPQIWSETSLNKKVTLLNVQTYLLYLHSVSLTYIGDLRYRRFFRKFYQCFIAC